ncbi:MAG: cytochrome c maturation protein CcmE [Fimbriimonadaceae bacterium]
MKTPRTRGKFGLWITVAVVAVACVGMISAFANHSSPYVSVAQAKSMEGTNLHVAGDLVKETLRQDPARGKVHFVLVDDKGDRIEVDYTGAAPANMGEATKIVAVGGMDGDRFKAHRLLVKCPSKYEGAKEYEAA